MSGYYSPDGHYWWNGQSWQPVANGPVRPGDWDPAEVVNAPQGFAFGAMGTMFGCLLGSFLVVPLLMLLYLLHAGPQLSMAVTMTALALMIPIALIFGMRVGKWRTRQLANRLRRHPTKEAYAKAVLNDIPLPPIVHGAADVALDVYQATHQPDEVHPTNGQPPGPTVVSY